ncbi:MAG: hypothetical protein BWY57_03559 [Betaproteobacteria bacterium ADurb.Bin341]|nr:MAG: hypothetical protein BWY57_03559 [Betaproteobacteria bacterium ADurb.Bin341]
MIRLRLNYILTYAQVLNHARLDGLQRLIRAVFVHASRESSRIRSTDKKRETCGDSSGDQLRVDEFLRILDALHDDGQLRNAVYLSRPLAVP